MKEFWNDRYRQPEFAYGEAPNAFLREQLHGLPTGSLLLPADGEGRNAVYAASRGWTPYSSDISQEGKNKAEKLARRMGVTLDYSVGDFGSLQYPAVSFDVAALIYAHFAPEKKATYHQKVDELLKPGGLVLLEGFSKNHLKFNRNNPEVGGPKDAAFLLSTEEIRSFFPEYEYLQLEEVEIDLQEGAFHKGRASVIRFLGRKPRHS
jgi:cyclopropane fatty-acyl-phospholipid synthase-like methyltransferase